VPYLGRILSHITYLSPSPSSSSVHNNQNDFSIMILSLFFTHHTHTTKPTHEPQLLSC
jgi:hypothetical protein